MLKSTHQLAAVAALSWCTLPAFGAEPAPRPEGQSVFQVMPAPTDNVSGENRVMFASPGDASDAMNAMRRRLADPAQRAVVRSEQRAVMQGLYQDLEEALQIDGSTASRLLDALTDQEMDRQDAYATEFPDLQERADAENRRLDELFVILGERGAERFQDYTATLGPRRQVNEFDARLAAGDKLQPAQKEQLMALLADQRARNMKQQRPRRAPMAPVASGRQEAIAELKRSLKRSDIEDQEASLHRMLEGNRVLAAKGAVFLTPTQCDTLSKMQEARVAALRDRIERARVQAGLNPQIPDSGAGASSVVEARVSGDIKLDVRVIVNRSEPRLISLVGRSGESSSFEAGEGLSIEVTPTLQDDWLFVDVTYFEVRTDGTPRRLSSRNGVGLNLGLSAARGDSNTVVSGRRAYAVVLSIQPSTNR